MDNITLYVMQAKDQNGTLLGWSAVAIRQNMQTIWYMEFGQYREHSSAAARLKAIQQYIGDWEQVSGVRYTLENLAPRFAASDGLSDQWEELSPHDMKDFANNAFELYFFNGVGFRPDLTLEDRIQWHAPGISELYGSNAVASKAEEALQQLTEELGRTLTEVEATQMALGWGTSALLNVNWTIEIAPAVGDHGEDVGFSVIGVVYDANGIGATIFDLSEPLPYEYQARAEATRHRLALELLKRVSYALVHRDGVISYFKLERQRQGIDHIWQPFHARGTELELLLSWGLPLMRGSMVLDGSMPRSEWHNYYNEMFMIGAFSEDTLRDLEQDFGCEDVVG